MLGAKVNIMGRVVLAMSLFCGVIALQMISGCSPSEDSIDVQDVENNDDEQPDSSVNEFVSDQDTQIVQNNAIE